MTTPRRAVAAVALLAVASAAGAAEFSGEAVTVFRLVDLVQDIDGVQKVRSYRPLDQLLRLGWHDVGARRAWSVDVALRGRMDLATDLTGGTDDFDVLTAHADWRSPRGLVRLRIGRQQAVTGFGWHVFDGARVDLRAKRRGRFFLHVGFPIDVFENDEPDLGSFTWAAGATALFPGRGSFGVDYEVRRFGAVTTDENAGADLSLTWGRTTLAANADYSVLLDRLGETTTVLRHGVTRRHWIEARLTRVEPIFPSDSIWAVFDANPYDEARLSWEYRGDTGLRIGAFLSEEDYRDTEFPGPQDVRRVAATFSWTRGPRRVRHRGELGWQRGFSGSRLGGRYDVDWSFAPRWRAGAGASLHRYENAYRLSEEDETAAVRARVRHDHFGRWDLALEVEQHVGRQRDTLRATLVFGTKLGRARHSRPWWSGRFGESVVRGGATRRELRDAAAEDEAGETVE